MLRIATTTVSAMSYEIRVPRSAKSTLLSRLLRRGLVSDCSGFAELDDFLLGGGKVSVYAGFDPTAASLHVGHLTTFAVLRAFADEGHEILPLVGDGTALIGDPTGKSKARPVMSRTQVSSNAAGIEESIKRALPGCVHSILRNADWLSGAGLVEFLREVGSLIPMSRLLAQESVKSRLGSTGISYLEAAYPLLQAWDFLRISRSRTTTVQVGGSDQWGNISMGLELIGRSSLHGRSFGLTHPLLTDSGGRKIGKTSGNPVWLNPAKTDDFTFHQFWRTMPDADAPRIASMLLGDPFSEAHAPEHGIEHLKSDLAYGATSWIRGTSAADDASAASMGKGAVATGLPVVEASRSEMDRLDVLLVRAGVCASNSEARRLAGQGGLRINGIKRTALSLDASDLVDAGATVSVGRTRHFLVRISGT